MSATHYLPRPKSEAEAEASFLRVMGDPRRLSKILAIAVVGSIGLNVGLLMLNFRTLSQQREKIVVRIDDVGRAQAVGFSLASVSKLQPNETKYFLSQFVHNYYGRNHATVHDDFARSLMFLSGPLASTQMEAHKTAIEKFLVSTDDDIEIKVNNIILVDLATEPYSAQVDLEKIYRDRSGNETKREKYVEGITWRMSASVDNAAITVNPLGFMITSLREDQAF